jgi:GTP pyrophosphokinase
MTDTLPAALKELLHRAGESVPAERLRMIEDAYQFAYDSHDGQMRKSGEPYIIHPLDAALTVADLNLDGAAIAAALLHDVVEDCDVKPEEIAKRFGDDVARLVEGVTKLNKLNLLLPDEPSWDEAVQADNLRKMFLAMADDIRVVIIKLADRLHNLRTLEHLAPEKQKRIARETMELYAPLAQRLGLGAISHELEDLCFMYLEPEQFREISESLRVSRENRESYVTQVVKLLGQELQSQGITAELAGRAKHVYSIHLKMKRYAEMGKSFNDIYDLLAIRVLVDNVSDCYHALGVVHGLWRPLPGLFDDYIANPRENVYQSLHTTVMGPGARPLEVQIRTYEMHRTAEYGVASHWRYKEGGRTDKVFEERINWLRQLLDWQREATEATEFVEYVKTDMFQDQVFVFSPKGEVKELPAGATPIDFAFRIHTDIGFHAVGAKVNGRLVSLTYQLQNGDVVEIVTSRSRGPSRDWLNPNLGYVRTGHARTKLRQWFKRQEHDENVLRGKEMTERELKRLNVSLANIQADLLDWFHFENADDFFAAVGYGGVGLTQIAGRIVAHQHAAERELALSSPQTLEPLRQSPASTGHAIKVMGTGDVLTLLARCCRPVPGDPIVGYVTRARGVTVHRSDCANVTNSTEPERLVDAEWGQRGEFFPVSVRVEAFDRVGLLRDLTTIAADEKVNLTAVRTLEHVDRSTTVLLTLETSGVEQLSRLFAKLEGVYGVHSVSREQGYAARPRVAHSAPAQRMRLQEP